MSVGELSQTCDECRLGKRRRNINPQLSSKASSRRIEHRRRLSQTTENIHDPFVKLLPLCRKPDLSGRTLKKSDPKRRFQILYGSGDLRAPQLSGIGGLREACKLGNTNKNLH